MVAAGVGPVELARRLGRENYSRYSQMRNNKQAVPSKELEEISHALGIRQEWLASGTGPMLASSFNELSYTPLEDESYFQGHYTPKTPGALPEIDVATGAGEGVVGDVYAFNLGSDAYSGHRVVGEWVFPQGYLSQEARVNRATTLVMPVVGDSMTPTYHPSDRLIVDTSQSELVHDGVYVISDGSSPPQVKRLQRVMFTSPQEVEIISDNPLHTPQRVRLSELYILGRVAGVVSIR